MDSWIGVGLQGFVPPLSNHPIEIAGEGLVLWRGDDGQVRVWEDRCPHRGMRLSFGFVRGNELTCLYHGWRYNLDGQCTAIPAHPEVTPAKAICTKPYSVGIRAGIIFTNLSDDPATPLPDLPDGNWQAVRSIVITQPLDQIASQITTLGLFGKPAERLTDGLFKVVFPSTGLALVSAQPISENKTALHVSFRHDDGGEAVQTRLSLARELVAHRTAIEQEF